MQKKRSNRAGIEARGGKYRAVVWSARDGRKLTKTFDSLAAAKAWRRDVQVALDRGEVQARSRLTVAQAAEAWLEGARSGVIRNRSGDAYKPSVIRTYEIALRLRVLPE